MVALDLQLALEIAKTTKMFTVNRAGGLVLVSYRFFDRSILAKYPMAKELRGAIWEESTSKLVSRPFHKFFSIGELEGDNALGPFVGTPLRIADKVDGYLVQSFFYGGEVRHASRLSLKMGKIGRYLARVWTKDHENLFFKLYNLYGPGTLLSELVHPRAPVLYRYDTPMLVVLAYRSLNGPYFLPGVDFQLEPGADPYALKWSESALIFGGTLELRRFYDVMVAPRKGMEGYVLFNGNDFIKLKTRESYQIASALMRLEEVLYQAILEDNVGELLRVYERRPDIQRAVHRFFDALARAISQAVALAKEASGLTRKEAYALVTSKSNGDTMGELVAHLAMELYSRPNEAPMALFRDLARKRKKKAIELIARHMGDVPRPAEPS